jgi:hypothetical protein
MARFSSYTSAGLVLASFCASIACSAPAGGDGGDSVPDYVGPVPGGGSNGSPVLDNVGNGATQNPVGANGTGVTPVASGNEGAGNNVPLQPGTDANGANGAGTPPGANAGGAGGASMVSPNDPGTPANGAGGSAMPSAAGSGNAPLDPGNQNPPATPDPGTPPPVTPPPVTPPAVDPGPVGTGCAPGAAFFCEDFEAFAVGTAQANDLWRPEGTVSIDGTTVQGTRSLHVQANAGQLSRIVLQAFAPPQNSFFGRMNVLVQQFPTSPNFAHYVLVEVTGNGGERVRPIGGQLITDQNTGNVWGVGSDGGATGDWTAWRATAPAEGGRWLCMEWQMDAADNSIDVYIDGTLKPELSVSTNDHDGNGAFNFPTFNNIWFGWTVFQGGSVPAPFNVFIDDIVLSTQRVGCN